MKKLLYISILIAIGIIPNAFSQGKIGNLNGIYYQAVAVDELGKEIVGTDISGKPVYKKAIGVRFTITKGLNGTIQWEETHTTTTDRYGQFTLIIGKGTRTSSAFTKLLDIPWIDADQFLKVELAIKNDGNYKLVSNQQFMTVPYSFYTDDIADDAITTFKILDSAILNQDIHTSAVDSRTILDSTIVNQDIHTSAVDSRTLLDSTIINQDIRTGAVDSRTFLDSTIINQDIRTGAVDSRTLLDSTIVNQDIHTGAVDSRTLLDSTIINQDIHTGAVDSRTLLDSAIVNQDIRTGAVDSRTLLDSAIINQDIHTSAVDSRTLLDSTIINQDIHTSAVDSRTLLDSTIINQDIRTGAVDSRTLLDSAIVNQDIRTDAVDSRLILNGTILNEDIADTIINLATRVTGILSVVHGGTGVDTLLANSLLVGNDTGAIHSLGKATDGQIPVGVTDSLPKLKVLAGAGGVNVSITADSVIISSRISGIFSVLTATIDPGVVFFTDTWISPPIPLPGVVFGDIIIGSVNVDLKGCQMTTYVSAPDVIRVAIYNGTGPLVDLGLDRNLNVMVVR